MLMLMPLAMEFGWDAQQFSWSVRFFSPAAACRWTMGRLTDKIGHGRSYWWAHRRWSRHAAMALQTASLMAVLRRLRAARHFWLSGLAIRRSSRDVHQTPGKGDGFFRPINFARACIVLVINC